MNYEVGSVTVQEDDVRRAVEAAIESGSDLTGVKLRRARLIGAFLHNANLSAAHLRGANLTYTCLTCADLHGADLTGANLSGANLYFANLSGANLTGAKLTGANLRDAHLRGANLRDANLTCADLSDANLIGADLTGANLRDADLRGADLTGAVLPANPYIVLIEGTRDTIVAVDDDVQIGCKRHTIGWWLDHFEAVGQDASYSPAEIAEYGLHLAQVAAARPRSRAASTAAVLDQ